MGTSPGDPWGDAHSIVVVVTRDFGASAQMWPEESEIAAFIQGNVRRRLDEPAATWQHPRQDVPVRVLSSSEFYRSFVSDFDLVFLFNFFAEPLQLGDQPGEFVVSYAVFGDYFGSDDGVIRGTGTEDPHIGAWINSGDKEKFFDDLDQLLAVSLREPVATIRAYSYRDISMKRTPIGSRQRLFAHVRHIKVTDTYFGDSTNDVALRYVKGETEEIWAARALASELHADSAKPGNPRPDIAVGIEPSDSEGGRKFRLFSRTRDQNMKCGQPQCTLETVVAYFVGPGSEMLLTGPRSFLVPEDWQRYRENFMSLIPEMASEIIFQLRKGD